MLEESTKFWEKWTITWPKDRYPRDLQNLEERKCFCQLIVIEFKDAREKHYPWWYKRTIKSYLIQRGEGIQVKRERNLNSAMLCTKEQQSKSVNISKFLSMSYQFSDSQNIRPVKGW